MLTLICGVLRLDGAPSEDDLGPMCGALSFERGPQISKSFSGALSCARVSFGSPEQTRDGGLGLSTEPDDGLLIADLNPYSDNVEQGRSVSTHEAVRAALQQDGWRAAQRIQGDFALAHWNSGSQTLFLARDHAGVRPLFFTYRPKQFLAFASFPDALIAGGFVNGQPNMEVLAKDAVSNMQHGAQTYLEGVQRVLPAHVLTFRHGHLEQHRYWRLACRNPIPETADFSQAAGKLRDHIRTAIRRRLPLTGSIATELSGGLDSSAIAAMAANELASTDISQPDRVVLGYNFRPKKHLPDVEVVDEFNHASAVAQQVQNLRLQTVEYSLPKDPGARRLSPSFPIYAHDDRHDSPFLSDAADKGATIMFSGLGGDELISFNGRGLAAEYLMRLQWGRLARLLEARTETTGRSAWRELGADVVNYMLPTGLAHRLRRKFSATNFGSLTLDRFLKPAHHTSAVDDNLRLRPDTRKNRRILSESGHLTVATERLAWTAAQHGLRYVFPMMDRELQEFAIRLPGGFFERKTERRAVFREAMGGILPDMVLTRRIKGTLDPGAALTVLENRDAYLATLDQLERKQMQDSPFDIGAIRDAIQSLPDIETLIEDLNAAAENGEQYKNLHTLFAIPMILAQFAEQTGQREGQ